MRIAIISDIHSNLAALEAVLADAGAVDELWCPGDVVGYGPNPNECVDILRHRRAICVAGNHDWAAIDRLSTADFNVDAATAAKWTAANLTPQSRRFLEGLPLTHSTGKFTLVHGTLRNPIWEYLLSPAEADDTFSLLKTPYCLVGHTHLPLVFVSPEDGRSSRRLEPPAGRALGLGDERLILNPGSVGQPRDGNPAASYALLDRASDEIECRRVSYDIERTQLLMQQFGLPARLWQRLSYGW